MTNNPKLETFDMQQNKTIDLNHNLKTVTRNWTY